MGLTLTRKVGEKIVIGDDIEITVIGRSGSEVKLMIDAPRGVLVDRAEIRARRVADAEAGRVYVSPRA